MSFNAQQQENWLKKRRHTFIAFSIQMTIIGMEWSFTILTLWLYIKEMINTDMPKLYYCIVSVSFILASSIASPFIGRIVDKKRNVKFSFLICNLLMLVGNVIYSLPFSPVFLVVGRFISGFGGSLESVSFGETIRSYPAGQTSSKLSILSIMQNFGMLVGPGINFFFKDINFFIGFWQLRGENFPGLFMGFLCTVMQVITLTMVHDLSKEFDFKASENANRTNIFKAFSDDNGIGISDNNGIGNNNNIDDNERLPLVEHKCKKVFILSLDKNKNTVKEILKVLFYHLDSALLMFANFFLAFFFINNDIWLPLLVIEKMHLSVLELNIIFFGAGGVCTVILLLSLWRPFSDKVMVLLLKMSLCCYCIVSVSFIILSYFPYNRVLNVVLCVFYILSMGGAPILSDVFFVNTLAKMVSSNVQTFVDSIRHSVYFAGAFLAFICSVFTFDYVEIFGTLYAFIMIIIGILFIVRRKHFISPKLLL